MKRKGEKILRPVHPNAGITADYRRQIVDLIDEMSASYEYWIRAAFRANEPAIMALDAERPRVTPVEGLPIRKVDRSTGKLIDTAQRSWSVYVDGELLRNKVGVGRIFQSQHAAEDAGLRAAGFEAVLTDPIGFGTRLDFQVFGAVPVSSTPALNLQASLDGLGARWRERIDQAAPRMANHFRRSVQTRSDTALSKILRESGMSVEFQMTPVMRDVAAATTQENVQLIKSIGSRYHDEVQGLVMRSVATGRDLGTLTKELHERYGITKRRAAFIALDQNNKATSSMNKARQTELGLDEGIWMHSHAGKVPRKTHLANNGKRFSISAGWFDPDPKVRKRIMPGQLPRCRCTWRVVLKGFS